MKRIGYQVVMAAIAGFLLYLGTSVTNFGKPASARYEAEQRTLEKRITELEETIKDLSK